MSVSPRRALLVIDVQNEYVTGALPIEYPDIQQSLANIGRAMDAAQTAGIPVVVVQNTSPPGSPVFSRGSQGWELHAVVAARPRSHDIEKTLPSAFAGTDLAEWLGLRGIDTLVVVGYMTHNCDDSTVKDALHAGLAVEFLADAAGSLPYENHAGRASAEEIHRVFTVAMQSRFAAVATTDQWIAALQTGGALPRDNIYLSNRRARGLATSVGW
jgi:nicotinamidase-related amidase